MDMGHILHDPISIGVGIGKHLVISYALRIKLTALVFQLTWDMILYYMTHPHGISMDMQSAAVGSNVVTMTTLIVGSTQDFFGSILGTIKK